jgi:hypothetical protein
MCNRDPFLFELRGESEFILTIGFAGGRGCAQHSPTDGSPPYLMTVDESATDDGQFIEPLAGNRPTNVPQKFLKSNPA